MHTSIALLRGINVGGKNKLSMKELVQQLETLQLENIQTYIQSGNVVFQTKRKPATKLATQISEAIEDSHGFVPSVMVLSKTQLENITNDNPFPKAIMDAKTLHVFFLSKPAKKANIDAIEKVKAQSERYELTDDAFYLHAPDGFGRSKLAVSVEKHLGVAGTARNWNTVQKLRDMVEDME